MYVIAACPWSKIFVTRPDQAGVPSWQERCVANPNLIFDTKEPFKFKVKRSVGAVPMEYNKPLNLQTLMRRNSDRKDMIDLFNYLTGGLEGAPNRETDQWGIAPMDMGYDATQILSEVISLKHAIMRTNSEKDKKKLTAEMHKMEKILEDGIVSSKASAQQFAEERVLRVLERNYDALLKQWELNRQEGKDKHTPSNVELLAALILKQHSRYTQRFEVQSKINEMFKEASGTIQGARLGAV